MSIILLLQMMGGGWDSIYIKSCIHSPNKSFSQLLDISPKNFVFSKTFISEFSYIEIWHTDQNSKLLKLEDKIKITLVVN